DQSLAIRGRKRLILVARRVDRGPRILDRPRPLSIQPRTPDVCFAHTAGSVGTEIQPTVRGRPGKPFRARGVDGFRQALGSAPLSGLVPFDSPDIQVLAAGASGLASGDEIEPAAVGREKRVGLEPGSREIRGSGLGPAARPAATGKNAPA